MAEAKAGDTVQVHYTGRLEDGTVFDSSEGNDPLGFTLGAGQVIPGFEAAVLGLAPGEARTVTITPADAYGLHREDLLIEVSRDQIPPDLDPQVGQQLQLTLADGQPLPVMVADASADAVMLDANHPLAGQTLIFEVALVTVA